MPIKIKKFLFIIIAGILVFLLGENIIIAQLIDWAPKYVAYFDSTLTRARGIGAGIIQPIFILTLMMASYYFVRLNKFNSEEKRICYVAATRARERLYWMAENPVKKEYPRGNRAKAGVYDDSTGATITW